jgi:uncharacterized protein YcnI
VIPCPTTWRRAAVLALAAVLLVAWPADAHPFFRGGEAPVDSLATLTLAMAHGCGSEAAGGGDPTTDVSMEVPEWMRVVEVPQEDGYIIDVERDDAGTPTVVTWTAEEPREPAPDFDVDVVVSGEPGDERFVRVFQACGDFVYRWVGTPDEPADEPAVRLALVAADPDSPPPPEPEPQPAPEPDDPAEESADDLVDQPAEDAEQAIDEPADDPIDGEVEVDVAAVETDAGGSGGLWVVLVALAVALVGAGVWLARRRSAS